MITYHETNMGQCRSHGLDIVSIYCQFHVQRNLLTSLCEYMLSDDDKAKRLNITLDNKRCILK